MPQLNVGVGALRINLERVTQGSAISFTRCDTVSSLVSGEESS